MSTGIVRPRPAPWSRLTAVVVALVVAATVADPVPSAAEVTAVDGLAFNYFTSVSLFGGPAMVRGHGQPADAPADAVSPSVTCPEAGGPNRASDADGAKAQYGPAVVFGGKWPEDQAAAPPSGPLAASLDCKLGAGGSVTASTDLTLMPAGSAYPGGAGPGPFIADEVHSTCTAPENGDATGSTRIVSGTLETRYDPSTQLPVQSEPIPAEPSANYERTGTIDHVGDSYRIVLNEQVSNGDGSITVTAAHMYLLGPTAVGEMVIGRVTCGVTAVGAPATTATAAPAAGGTTPTTARSGALAGTETSDNDSSGAPVALIGVLVVAAGVAAWLWARRRRGDKGDELPGAP